MSKSISIVDYGVGNLLSVARAVSSCGIDPKIVKTPEEIKAADKILLPGVGSFGHCMDELIKRDLKDAVKEYINSGKYLLGICVGMQILHSVGEEFGNTPGLDIIPGKVTKISAKGDKGQHKIPFIGWAKINHDETQNSKTQNLFEGIDRDSSFYFVHSFSCVPENQENILSTYNYNGLNITALVGKENVFGCQFHPEKSAAAGLKLIDNFIKL